MHNRVVRVMVDRILSFWRLCDELNDTTSLLDLLLSLSGDVAGADDDGDSGETTLSEDLGVTVVEEVEDGGVAGLVGEVLGALLGGAVVTETVFTIPGMGRLVVQSIARRDYPVIQGAVMAIAMTYIFVNLIVDLLYAVLDPRVRTS